jgi:hypothetical protein
VKEAEFWGLVFLFYAACLAARCFATCAPPFPRVPAIAEPFSHACLLLGCLALLGLCSAVDDFRFACARGLTVATCLCILVSYLLFYPRHA